MQVAKRFGTEVCVVKETADGDIDTEHLQLLLNTSGGLPGLTVVSISHIPTSSGRVYDAAAVGRCVSAHPGAPLLTALLTTHYPAHCCEHRGSGCKWTIVAAASCADYSGCKLPIVRVPRCWLSNLRFRVLNCPQTPTTRRSFSFFSMGR